MIKYSLLAPPDRLPPVGVLSIFSNVRVSVGKIAEIEEMSILD
jgi:hypothetical protein